MMKHAKQGRHVRLPKLKHFPVKRQFWNFEPIVKSFHLELCWKVVSKTSVLRLQTDERTSRGRGKGKLQLHGHYRDADWQEEASEPFKKGKTHKMNLTSAFICPSSRVTFLAPCCHLPERTEASTSETLQLRGSVPTVWAGLSPGVRGRR